MDSPLYSVPCVFIPLSSPYKFSLLRQQTNFCSIAIMPPKCEKEGIMKLETAPFDPRFPNQNVTRYCYQSYVDFHRCQKKRGENYEPCNYFKNVFQSMCPNAWVEKWNDQRENGTFPGKI